MRWVREALLCALLLALILLALRAIVLMHIVDVTLLALPGEIAQTRAELLAEVRGARVEVLAKANAQVTGIRRDAMTAIREQGAALNGQVAAAITVTDKRTEEALGQVAGLRGELAPTLAHVESVVAHVDDALPAFTDCAYLDADGVPVGGNPDCAFNRFQGTSKAIERMAQAAASAAPAVVNSVKEIAHSGEGIAASGDAIAADFKRGVDDAMKPKHWYEKLLGPVYTIGRLVAVFL